MLSPPCSSALSGAWGEWGSSLQEYDRKQIANAICDMVPKNVYIQGRYMDVTAQMFGRSTFPRVGYHSDFMVGRPHPWNTAYDKYYAPYYWLFAATSAHRINDGEMPWVGATEEPDEYVDGQKFLQQCYEYHLSTFSIEHQLPRYASRPGPMSRFITSPAGKRRN